MLKTIAACCMFLLAACAPTPRDASPRHGAVAITGVTVIDVAAPSPEAARLPGRTVIVDNGRIAAVSGHGAKLPPGARRIDGRGRFLVPGLWDSHTHLGIFGEPSLPLLLSLGVTSVRDMGGDPALLGLWQREVAAGRRVGPRIYHAGPIIEGAWWLDGVTKGLAAMPELGYFPFLQVSPRLRLAAPADAASLVGQVKASGADLVKFRNLRPDEFRAVAAAAARAGMPLVGHNPRGVLPGEAARLGMASIEHMETVSLALAEKTEAERLAEFRRLAATGVGISLGMTTGLAYRGTPDERVYAVVADTANRIDPRRRYLSRLALDAWRWGTDIKKMEGEGPDHAKLLRRQLDDIRLARTAGVPFLIGTDVTVPLVYPGYSVHEEMAYLVREAGLAPLEVLRAATLNAALAMRDGESGRIAPGQRADLLLLAADPLKDIPAAADIDAVIAAGRLFDRAALGRLREESAALAARQ